MKPELTRFEVSSSFTKPMKGTTRFELFDEVLVSIGNEEGVEESRTSGFESKVGLNDSRSVLISFLDTSRESGTFPGTDRLKRRRAVSGVMLPASVRKENEPDNVGNRSDSGNGSNHSGDLKRVESIESEDGDATTGSRESVVGREERERLLSLSLLSRVRLLGLRYFNVESFGNGDGEVVIDLVPAHDVTFLSEAKSMSV
jgi:hypothetical protein